MEKQNERTSSARILIIEDDRTTSLILSEILKLDKHTVKTASTGRSALERLASFKPDVILSDLNLPDEDGLSLLRQIRTARNRPFTPVIVVSARDDTAALVEGLEYAEDYLIKPVDPVELRARVRSMVRLKSMHNSIEELNRSLESRVRERTEELSQSNKKLQQEAKLRTKSETEVRRLSRMISDLQETERARFAREIHDALGTSLLTLKLMIQTNFHKLDRSGRQKDLLKEMIHLVDETTRSARELAHSLSPAILTRIGFPAAVKELVENLRAANPQIRFRCETGQDFPRMSESWNREVYRLIQEALTNALKHSGADEITVYLSVKNGLSKAGVRDNGKGIGKQKKSGIGLLVMRERAASVGWYLSIKSNKGKGTEVSIERKNRKKTG